MLVLYGVLSAPKRVSRWIRISEPPTGRGSATKCGAIFFSSGVKVVMKASAACLICYRASVACPRARGRNQALTPSARGIIALVQQNEIDLALAAESDRVEWKSSTRATDAVLLAVCALANDLGDTGRPGYVVLGMDDRGRAVGAETSDAAQQALANRLRSVKILPNPSVTTAVVSRDGTDLVILRVDPYPVPPIVKVDGIAWVRVATTTHVASDADLQRLRERRPENALPFDLRGWRAAGIDDLDLRTLARAYDDARSANGDPDTFPPLEAWLGQRDITRRALGEWRPTPAGILVHGVDPQGHFPGAAIEFVRYAGTDFDAPVSARKTITGTVPDQLDAAWAQLQAHVADVPGPAPGIRTTYVPEYPLEALKELARNLVQHRMYEGTHAPSRISWFEDRVIFNNPGGPFGQASEGEFGAHSDYRNPTITRFLVELGYVERLGRGVRRVQLALADNGNPPLEVEVDGFTTIAVRGRR